jgi:hypothetical protein
MPDPKPFVSNKLYIRPFAHADIPRVIAELQALLPIAEPPDQSAGTVIFREDWTGIDGIYPPDVPVPNRRWTDGSDYPNAYLAIVHLHDNSRRLEAYIRDAHNGMSDGARAFMTMDDARWDDLPALEGQTVFWRITVTLADMPLLEHGAGKWFSLAEIKRTENETPAGLQVNVRGDRGFNELYLFCDGKSYYHPDPQPVPSNVPLTLLLEVTLKRDGSGAAWLTHDGVRFGGAGRTMGDNGGAAFALTCYGNSAASLKVRFGEVVFGALD